MRRPSRIFGFVGSLAIALGAAVFVAGSNTSCQSPPAPISLRSFMRPQKIAVLCMRLYDASGNALPLPMPLEASACPPVPPNVVGSTLANHMFALVTQQTRGQVAAVDLTAGNIVDEDRSTPGTNFIPVGADPADLVVSPGPTPDHTFVATGAQNSFAVFAIPNTRILGDSIGWADAGAVPLQLTDLLACTLPQPPQSIGLVALPENAGGSTPPYALVVVLRPWLGLEARVVTLDPRPLTGASSGLIPGVLSPCTQLGSTTLSAAFPAGSTPGGTWSDGVPYADAGGVITVPSPGLGCAVGVADAGSAPSGSTEAGAAPDASGADGADAGGPSSPNGGADASEADATEEAEPSDDGGPAVVGNGDDAGVAGDAGALDDAGDAGSAEVATTAAEAGAAEGGGLAQSLAGGFPLPSPRPTFLAVRDDAPVAYVSDGALPLIHVIQLGGDGAPQEVAQYLATSIAQPTRLVTVGQLALSPTTSDRRRYLYAIDSEDGSLMVFEATSPIPPSPPETPLVRPHAELNPFSVPDRISFSAPIATVTFAAHDWPLSIDTVTPTAYTGLFCNPNPNALTDGGTPAQDGGLGAYYRADRALTVQPQSNGVSNFPLRLRGVFAFAALTTGSVVTIDVDDWDAPCRRPDPMQNNPAELAGQSGALDLPEPAPSGPSDLDPYHAPTTTVPSYLVSGVTQEAFFPVSAPNRIRSTYLLRNDATSGDHVPTFTSPLLYDSNGALYSAALGSAPTMLPTSLASGFIDPSYISNPTASDPSTYTSTTVALENAAAQNAPDAGAPLLLPNQSSTPPPPGVRLSYDDPTVHIDQDWTVTYEGVLPTANGILGLLSSADGYQSLWFAPGPTIPDASVSNGAQFCARGIEDWNVGRARVAQAQAEVSMRGLGTYADDPGTYTGDYVEMIDDLLPEGDPYWYQAPTGDDDCWANPALPGLDVPAEAGPVPAAVANERYNACFSTFNSSANADTTYSRDLPILQATDNALHLGRFGWPNGSPEFSTNRTVVGPDPSNPPFLKFATCCFQRQVGVKVRAGGEWLTVGNGTSPLGLLHHVVKDPSTGACVIQCNDPDRALLNARALPVPPPASACAGMPEAADLIDRTSPLAMRNPMFSFVMWGGCTQGRLVSRDAQWRFSLRGSFSPLTVNLGGPNASAVSPQSMLYVAPFGQLAVVDGAQQGLVVIDVNTMAFSHNPFY